MMSTESPKNKRPRLEDYQRALESMGTLIDISSEDLMELSERAVQFASQHTREKVPVRQVMSQTVHVVEPQMTLAEAAHIMVTKRISGIPVVDQSQHLVGLITEADLLRGLGIPAHHPKYDLWQTLESLFHHFSFHEHLETPDASVSEYMSQNVICITPNDDVLSVIDIMKKHHVKRLPVCDKDHHVAGMVTRSDLVRIFFDKYTKNSTVKFNDEI